jgi:hypothetical protein
MQPTTIGQERNAGLIILFSFLTLGIYYFIWYYQINKEIKLHDPDQDFSPGLACLALFFPIANLVSAYNTADRVKKMQKTDGSRDLINPGVALVWFLLFGMGYVIYLQGVLNHHWYDHHRVLAPMDPVPQMARPVLSRPGPYPSLAQRKRYLDGLAGPMANRSIELTGETLIIGRDPQLSQVIVDDGSGTISRRHCLLRYDTANDNYALEDCGSTNGTFLGDGHRLVVGRPYALRPGDQFYLAETHFLFQLREG